MLFRLDFRMPMLQASGLSGASPESDRLLHPGNAMLRRAIQENLVSFPSQIPVFSKQARPEMQWKAVLLFFVRGWPICDISARFGVGTHRISKVVDEWATRAIALGYIQVIDAERFAEWSGSGTITGDCLAVDSGPEAAPGPPFEARGLSVGRVDDESVDDSTRSGWRPYRSTQPTHAGLVTALDTAIRSCEDRSAAFFSQAAIVLRDLRRTLNAGESGRAAYSATRAPHISTMSRLSHAPAEEKVYAFNS